MRSKGYGSWVGVCVCVCVCLSNLTLGASVRPENTVRYILSLIRGKNERNRSRKPSLKISISLQTVKVFHVSIPQELPTPQPLNLHLPISAYLSAPVHNLQNLSNRISSQSLPNGWVKCQDTSEGQTMTFARLTVNSALLDVSTSFLVKVDRNLEWTLGCHGVQVQINQCPVVSTIPRIISCTNDLIHIPTACSNSACSLNW